MITLKQDIDNTFLIYRTHLETLSSGDVLKLKNVLSNKIIELPFEFTALPNAYRLQIPVFSKLKSVNGECMLTFYDAQTGSITFEELAKVI